MSYYREISEIVFNAGGRQHRIKVNEGAREDLGTFQITYIVNDTIISKAIYYIGNPDMPIRVTIS